MFILQKVRVRFQRLYTREGADPFDTTAWRSQTDADGNAYVLPASWGGMAPDLLAEKIFAPRPPASALKPQSGGSVPDWLRPQVCAPDAPRADWQAERDLRDVLHRVAGGLCYTAFRAGLFDDAADAREAVSARKRPVATWRWLRVSAIGAQPGSMSRLTNCGIARR